MVSRSSAMMSSALGPSADDFLSVNSFRKSESSLLKILVSPPLGPNETIEVSLPFLFAETYCAQFTEVQFRELFSDKILGYFKP